MLSCSSQVSTLGVLARLCFNLPLPSSSRSRPFLNPCFRNNKQQDRLLKRSFTVTVVSAFGCSPTSLIPCLRRIYFALGHCLWNCCYRTDHAGSIDVVSMSLDHGVDAWPSMWEIRVGCGCIAFPTYHKIELRPAEEYTAANNKNWLLKWD